MRKSICGILFICLVLEVVLFFCFEDTLSYIASIMLMIPTLFLMVSSWVFFKENEPLE